MKVVNIPIRRFVPKGTDMDQLLVAAANRIAHWMNHHPGREFNSVFASEISSLAAVPDRYRPI